MRLISSFLGCEYRVAIVEEYDRRSLLLILMKSYHHLYPLFEAKSSFNNKSDEDISLDIFEMVARINVFANEFSIKKLLMGKPIFQWYH